MNTETTTPVPVAVVPASVGMAGVSKCTPMVDTSMVSEDSVVPAAPVGPTVAVWSVVPLVELGKISLPLLADSGYQGLTKLHANSRTLFRHKFALAQSAANRLSHQFLNGSAKDN